MASIVRSWLKRIDATLRDPRPALVGSLANSGRGRWLAIVTMSLWLTPELYDEHLRPSKARSGQAALWTAAGLWLATMTLMTIPVIPLLQGAVTALGKRLGYWDEQFSSPITSFSLTALSFVVFVGMATIEWVQTWLVCIVDMAFGGRTISPPPFGYFATRIAGEIAAVAVFASALIFSIRPVNDPVWHWLGTAGGVQMIIIALVATALMIAGHCKVRTERASLLEIYGSERKALAYRVSFWIAMLAALWLFVARRHI
jgi:hypothetical protein